MADRQSEFVEKKKTCVFKRARRMETGHRRKKAETSSSGTSSDSGSDSSHTTAIFKREKKAKRGLVQSSCLLKKKVNLDSGDSSDGGRAKGGSVDVSFKGTGAVRSGPGDGGATATNEIETENSLDARAIFERSRKINQERKAGDGERDAGSVDINDRIYKGVNNYAKFIEKKDSAAGSAAKLSSGPQRAPANIRSTVRWDYAPDICKDYKETGFCGFGDSCKFMHDRSDYKFGWQLEREMASGTYGEDDEDDDKYKISSDGENDLPFKCYLCKSSFTNPVMTKCNHYFCEKCALDNYKKSQRCFACGAQTGGVFNPAKEIIKRMEKSKEEGKVGDEEAEDSSSWS